VAYRVDRAGSVTKFDRLPQGGIRVDAALTRVGVLTYFGPDGAPVHEYRPPDEVARADSLATLADAPVTDTHPPGRVTPETFQRYARGHVSGAARLDGDLVTAPLVIQDAALLGKIERGEAREVSCGYTCDLDDTPGTTPDGIRFDKIQRNIVYNHVAIVERGRAGSQVSLRLDSQGDTLTEDSGMTPEEIKNLQAELAKARTDLAAQTAKADAAQAQLATAQAKADAAADPAVVAQAVKARISLETQAAKVLGAEFKADALTDDAIRAAVIGKVLPSIKLDGKGSDYLAAMYDAAIAIPVTRADVAEVRAVVAGPAPVVTQTEEKTLDQLHADSLQARRKQYQAPLAVSAGK